MYGIKQELKYFSPDFDKQKYGVTTISQVSQVLLV